MDDAVIRTDALTLAQRIRTKQVSAVAVVDAVLQRIEALQPRVNAFITVTAEEAREAARRAEAAVMAGEPLGPLHGVPFSIKDLLFTRGVRTTMGSRIFADQVPGEDAVPVRRLREAGAILVGKTTTPEFGHKPMTDSPLFGATRNPWDLSRSAGGSSGGAAAAVATGQAPLALGTDGGGSIRLPASCCGIVGLKPTLGRVPHVQQADLFSTTSYIGPMARTVAEASACFDAIVGFDPGDPYSRPEPLDDPRDADVRGLRIGCFPGGQSARRSRRAEVLRGGGASSGRSRRRGRNRGRGRHGLRANLPGVFQGAARRPHTWQRSDKIARSLRESVERGARWSAVDWANAPRPAHRHVPSRSGALPSLRFPRVADHLATRAPLSITIPSSPSRSAGRPPPDPRGLVSLSVAVQPPRGIRPSRCRAGVVRRRSAHRAAGSSAPVCRRRVPTLAAQLERERPCGRPMPF